MARRKKTTTRTRPRNDGARVRLIRNVPTASNALQIGCTLTRAEAEKLGLVEGRDFTDYQDRQIKPDDVRTK